MIDVSVIIPVYNGEEYVKECIDSVLSQDTKYSYEILICDDGSIDNTYRIITSYETNKIKIFRKQHSGIVDALNLLLDNAKGRYIMRMDADDRMVSNRIEHQIDLMEHYYDIDLCGGGRICMEDNKEEGNHGFAQMIHFTEGNVIIHPTVVFRSSLNIRYEDVYPYAEDMYLYYKLLLDNKVLFCDPTPVIYYRNSWGKDLTKDKLMCDSGNKIMQLFKDYLEKETVQYPLDTKVNDKSGELTCVITFKNEGIQAWKTVESIRKTAPLAPIILVNDASNDGYDYNKIVQDFDNVIMYTNEKSMGVGPARDFGVSKVKTEYFVILDAHMRFWNQHWDTLLLKALIEHPSSIVTSNTIIMRKNGNGIVENEDGSDYNISLATGAFIVENDDPLDELVSKWAPHKEGEFIEIPSIMGAVYASNVHWWKYIRGLEGLKNYGNDESLLAIKTWLLGGKCYVINNWGVGHIYRKDHPYHVHSYLFAYNKLLLIELFVDDAKKKKEIYEAYKKNLAKEQYESLIDELAKEKYWIQDMKEYIRDRQVMSMTDYLEMNRNYVKK